MPKRQIGQTRSLTCAFALVAALGACTGPIDFDLRGKIGGSVDTSEAALKATADRPKPDDRGIISYPNYQVAVAKRGDTIATLAERVGLPAAELARYNGIQINDTLRRGEIIALPRRVAEPSPATGAAVSGPIRPAAEVDVTTLAAGAIDRADPTPVQASDIQTGVEPVRHKVARGETAFTIARLYNVSPRALAEWNALDRDYSIREGQFLLIPAVEEAPEQVAEPEPRVIEPGAGSPTPVPPSAVKPLPAETPPPAKAEPAPAAEAQPKPEEKKPVADIGQSQAKPSNAAMIMPVSGSIIREYAKGRNEGIDISASAGTTVKAAASGQVAAVTKNTENVTILVIRHPDDLVTIYTHIGDLKVSKGDAVSKGQSIAQVAPGDPSFVHFEVRKGFDSLDPMRYLQ
ncbi:LysM peptidoglycan-binding domain-containing M23 family metallopeptidase [Thalassococcus lentus]|uniref:LysM peptidoglycan-binding domain-containing M23 family metallopeptidase n=1 Tax=Thalassococcus lentus TaxID=1210524 RepID=A0ABT4XQB7_9RHOB|nr:LysM peptidoglycan-binding domain-containing M23 family metallopeptidase [Thalassococcus lentus]MDA7424135.1 LysM peptidoglycan-binding domain-containing M23 family metallopeptidase [Thalassococcus lentus]